MFSTTDSRKFIFKRRMKYEALNAVRALLPNQGYIGTLDMNSGYHLIDMPGMTVIPGVKLELQGWCSL